MMVMMMVMVVVMMMVPAVVRWIVCQNHENHNYGSLFWFIAGISRRFCNMRKTVISGILWFWDIIPEIIITVFTVKILAFEYPYYYLTQLLHYNLLIRTLLSPKNEVLM